MVAELGQGGTVFEYKSGDKQNEIVFPWLF